MSFITEKILEILKDEAIAISEIANAMMCSRSESYRRFKALNSCDTRIHDRKQKISDDVRQKRNIYKMLSHLKKEGFVEKMSGENGSLWSITNTGAKKLDALKNGANGQRSRLEYKEEDVDKLIIVAFDIPEPLRRHRAWLREALKLLGFNLFQKSVWMGNKKIPEAFIMDLKRRGIADFVDIFEAGNKGTLRSLK